MASVIHHFYRNITYETNIKNKYKVNKYHIKLQLQYVWSLELILSKYAVSIK